MLKRDLDGAVKQGPYLTGHRDGVLAAAGKAGEGGSVEAACWWIVESEVRRGEREQRVQEAKAKT